MILSTTKNSGRFIYHHHLDEEPADKQQQSYPNRDKVHDNYTIYHQCKERSVKQSSEKGFNDQRNFTSLRIKS